MMLWYLIGSKRGAMVFTGRMRMIGVSTYLNVSRYVYGEESHKCIWFG